MVYHEERKRNEEIYNYIVRNRRIKDKWKKVSKFIGKGELAKKEIDKHIEDFKAGNYEFLNKEDYFFIEDVKLKFMEDLYPIVPTFIK